MKILLVNDDGIMAEGIQTMAKELEKEQTKRKVSRRKEIIKSEIETKEQ